MTKFIEAAEYTWDDSNIRVALDPSYGIVVTLERDGEHFALSTIPPVVAHRVAEQLTKFANTINREISGGWVGSTVQAYLPEDDDCGCCDD